MLNRKYFIDPLSAMENFMANIGHSLKLKYGLASEPSKAMADRWYALTLRYISEGENSASAGSKAAAYLFPDFNTRHYASEADTIEALLREASGQDKK